ncbi:MAG: hypothetical protein LLG45_13315 [Actinomycetia bacterium]|nr:hypothetical protein [Actinomycetes bacterium]
MVLHLKEMELPSVAIELDITRHLRMDINAMRRFEERTGKDIMSAFPQPARDADGKILPPEQQPAVKMDLNALTTALWACLVYEDPTLTLDEAGILLTLAPPQDITRKMIESLYVCMPHMMGKGGKEAKEDKDPLARPTHLTLDPPGGGSSSTG